jgi:hypothetical protein
MVPALSYLFDHGFMQRMGQQNILSMNGLIKTRAV